MKGSNFCRGYWWRAQIISPLIPEFVGLLNEPGHFHLLKMCLIGDVSFPRLHFWQQSIERLYILIRRYSCSLWMIFQVRQEVFELCLLWSLTLIFLSPNFIFVFSRMFHFLIKTLVPPFGGVKVEEGKILFQNKGILLEDGSMVLSGNELPGRW